jgi:hypothetical protein
MIWLSQLMSTMSGPRFFLFVSKQEISQYFFIILPKRPSFLYLRSQWKCKSGDLHVSEKSVTQGIVVFTVIWNMDG